MNHAETIFEYLKHLLSKTFDLHFIPIKVFSAFFVTLFGFMFGFDMNQLLLGLLSLVILDFITGIASAYYKKEPIESRQAYHSAIKLFAYAILVSTAHITEQIVPAKTFLDDGMLTFLSITEMISVIENIGKMGFAIPNKVLNRLHELRGDENN